MVHLVNLLRSPSLLACTYVYNQNNFHDLANMPDFSYFIVNTKKGIKITQPHPPKISAEKTMLEKIIDMI